MALIDEKNSSHRYYLREIAEKLIGSDVKSGTNIISGLEVNK